MNSVKKKRISNYRKLDVLILTILSGVAIKFECKEHAPLGQKSIQVQNGM